jgi:hypothetical protein
VRELLPLIERQDNAEVRDGDVVAVDRIVVHDAGLGARGRRCATI